ncbi:PLC-like phosphodiesterase, TIM beta/alpha-barrel domain [Pseudocohnilembus persalinus]|uniref:PLC-like phosphodiesterase, TIM beta/alpha-barrel domain n=1 Tax=Pseudocohnilembus persalinus TaxID=266149 RepID=A0A0V0R0I8_PSEPJ|nr:PLC-like phosphodiesterase, TIM beta/alpha-barrel domain [Pseudocohnilembus persalinus]|eukprot:KRX07685.1 PLC-like phosphodiesterase, TIM beta/alpha-barrel domain [Pseudocohnilembus persalinus]
MTIFQLNKINNETLKSQVSINTKNKNKQKQVLNFQAGSEKSIQSQEDTSDDSFKQLDFENEQTLDEYYNSQLDLELTQVTAKCSHNSYEIGQVQEQLQFNETHPYQGGSQMLEFDIFPQNITDEALNNDTQEQQQYIFYTFHDQPKSLEECQTLSNFLDDIKEYHTNNKNHLPIFVTLNIKQWITEQYTLDAKIFYKNLEQTILNAFSIDDLYIPDDLLNGEQNLFTSVQKYGFPKVSALLGKIVFLVDCAQGGNETPKYTEFIQYYLEQDISRNLMFNTFDSRLIQSGQFDSIYDYMINTGNYNQIFINIKQNYRKDLFKQKYIKQFSILKEAQQLNLVTRGWNLSDIFLYTVFRKMGVNFACTDYIFDTEFSIAY